MHYQQCRLQSVKDKLSSIFVLHAIANLFRHMDNAGPDRKRRKGGVSQRNSEVQSSLLKESSLYQCLMEEFAAGTTSAACLAKLAACAVQDMVAAREGFLFPKLEKIAAAHASSNVSRCMYTLLQQESRSLPEPCILEIPYSNGHELTSILLPHEYFAAAYANPALWTSSILPVSSKLEVFWETMSLHPMMLGHPWHGRLDGRTKCLPLAVHGDEVPVMGVGKIWSRSSLVFSWFSILAQGSGSNSEEVMFYIWAIFEKFIAKMEGASLGTMESFWAVMKWSFTCVWDGTWPVQDWRGCKYLPGTLDANRAGKPLAGGYFGALLQLCGDLDYNTKWLGLPHYGSGATPCVLCRATQNGATTWMDNRPTAEWTKTEHTPETWRQTATTKCAIFQVPGMSGLGLAYDYMHCMFLGWVQLVYGSVMHVLCRLIMPHAPLDNLLELAKLIKQFQVKERTKHPYRHKLSKLTMFEKKKGYPKLRGRAADIMGLDATILHLWKLYADPNDNFHKRIQLLLELNLKVSTLLQEYSPSFGFFAVPEAPAAQLQEASMLMVQLHVQLMQHCKSHAIRAFNITSKSHFVIHSIRWSKFIHPFLIWCFKGETLMHKSRILWQSCLTGTKPHDVANRAALKYRYSLHLRASSV